MVAASVLKDGRRLAILVHKMFLTNVADGRRHSGFTEGLLGPARRQIQSLHLEGFHFDLCLELKIVAG